MSSRNLANEIDTSGVGNAHSAVYASGLGCGSGPVVARAARSAFCRLDGSEGSDCGQRAGTRCRG
jgi:hypothetical protein